MTTPRPRFSIVSAMYNVAPYLPEFIRSIEAQRFDLGRVELVMVDDGSTDGSAALVRAWVERRPGLVRLVTKENGGEASARNAGLEHATGEWVTFTDPDDMLGPDALAVADRFAAEHPAIELLGSRPLPYYEETGRLADDHPRRWQFDLGNRVVDLEQDPQIFTSGAPLCFFRLDRIRASGITFDTRIRPNFPDGHFAARYLLDLDGPTIGILRDAHYIYRRRAAGDSALQRSWGHPGKYGAVLEFGYLDLLRRARERHGAVPRWLQHLIIYELSWYLEADERATSIVQIPPEAAPAFLDLLSRILRQIDPAVVEAHQVRPMRAIWTDILAHGFRDERWHGRIAARTSIDRSMRLQRIAFRYVGSPPAVRIRIDGRTIRPAYGKVMAHRYFGRVLMEEQIVWVPIDGHLEVEIEGTTVQIVEGWPTGLRRERPLARLGLARRYGLRFAKGIARPVGRRVGRPVLRAAGKALCWVARAGQYRRAYADAWVLLDRVYTADDNGERLFEYLRAERPDINAWFVIERNTPDWQRLRAAGVQRVIAAGSWSWMMLMLNAAWVLSSHVDAAVLRPPRLMRFLPEAPWRFAFLQHGVIKDDLSLWLNGKPIDLFVVSTTAELESIVADGTTYEYTTKETRNTGLPRFDRLLVQGRDVDPKDRDLVIVAPTWRTFLTVPGDPGSQRRPVDDGFWTSDYLRAWSELLRAPALTEAAARRGWRVAFMPHPNLQPALPSIKLPAGVEALTFEGQDVQRLYARCALLITDYSSVAFNVAYIDGPVVYYQFDRDAVITGAHMGRQGYFDYERDGFGPVATDLDAAIAAIVRSIAAGPQPAPEYQARIARTFPQRDGRACERVVAAVEELGRPWVVST